MYQGNLITGGTRQVWYHWDECWKEFWKEFRSSLSENIIIIHRFIQRELRQLLGMDSPKLILVPPAFPTECPFTEEEYIKGWKSEQEVYEALRMSLQELHKENPECTLALFHGLRYGSTFETNPTGQKSDSIEGARDLEIDIIILALDAKKGLITHCLCFSLNIWTRNSPENLHVAIFILVMTRMSWKVLEIFWVFVSFQGPVKHHFWA